MHKDYILKKADEIKDELISIRRDIHAHPETGLNEQRTAALVADKLRVLGLDVKTGVGITGVLGTLKGKYPGKTVLIRADMDCLELNEINDIDYKSKYPGKMHACGHDAHTTWVLGAAMVLADLKDELHGCVKFLFQPAEETDGGAERMIKEGVLENPSVDAVIGAHVWPSIESGKIGVKYGPMMAAPDTFKLTVYGKGGHGAEPHNCVDPISVACQIYMSLQTIISRRIDPVEPVVITVGQFNAGTAVNIIPDRAEIGGTVRTLNHNVRKKVPEMMEAVIKGITEANGASYKLEYEMIYPPVINNDDITELIEDSAREFLGRENVVRIERPTMGGEDFSYFQQCVPGAFFIVGTYNADKGIVKPLHNPGFNIDEDILHKSSALLAHCALTFLKED